MSIVTSQQKTLEKHLNIYFGKLIYAVYSDREKDDVDGAKSISPWTTQTYENLIKPEAQRNNVTSRFTISTELQQCLAFLFERLVEEISVITLTGNEDHKVTIPEKTAAANDDHYVKFMFDCASRFESSLGETTKTVNDESKWFFGRLSSSITKYAADPTIIGAIYGRFNGFLKALAWLIGTFSRHLKTTIGVNNLLIPALEFMGMNFDMIIIMTSTIRKKPPTKTPKGKGKTTKDAKKEDKTDKKLSDIVPVENENVDLDKSILSADDLANLTNELDDI